MFSRRNFLVSSSWLCGSVSLSRPASVFALASKPSGYFGVHPFVDQHPEAVFIMRTHVDHKTNSGACKYAGLDFGRSVFVPMDNTGTPVTHKIAAKPNLTAHDPVDKKRGLTLEDTMGINTDVFFLEGLFESLKELGIAGNRMHTRDTNGGGVIELRGYVAMGRRVGATVTPVNNKIETPEDANNAGAFVWKGLHLDIASSRRSRFITVNGYAVTSSGVGGYGCCRCGNLHALFFVARNALAV